MSDEQPRIPAGAPGGGQFGAKAHAEADVDLSDQAPRTGLPELGLNPSAFEVERFVLHQRPTDPGERTDDFDLDAPYQRGSVWDPERQRNLIRSLLMGVPTGSVILSVLPIDDDRAKFVRVVDGKQRIESVRAFVDGDLEIPTDWLHPRSVDPAHRGASARFADMSDEGRRRFLRRPFPTIEFRPDIESTRQPDGRWALRTRSEDEMLSAEAELFMLVNFGGVEQTAEDGDRARAIADGPGAILG